jgi:uncharacterized circularly permuted ATP-grasp superfamily protein
MTNGPRDRAFDEGFLDGAHVKDADRAVQAMLESVDLERLREAMLADARGRGVAFRSAGGDEAFHVDPIPRIIDAGEWRTIADGVAQRVRALEEFVKDAYGERRIFAQGVMPARVLERAAHLEPELAGMGEAIHTWITVAGLDLVRDSDGAFKVLEDNVRTPSGLAYAAATRALMRAHVPMPEGLDVRSLDGAFTSLGRALRASAPPAAGDDPNVVLLSDGDRNSAFYEHREIAARLELPLLGASQLSSRAGRLYARIDGSERAVDVVYRRSDEDRLRDEHGQPTELGELLLEPVRGGTLACVNAFGTGVGDDKLVHAYVEQMIGFYLAEEPLLRSVPSYDPGDPDVLPMILDRIDELVVKPRDGYGGHGVVIGPHARSEDLRAAADAVARSPQSFVAQEMVMISRHPTVTDGKLEPRHVDLRPFALREGERVEVIPGGLTRVAMDRGALVVNSSQNGGNKDTWVLR